MRDCDTCKLMRSGDCAGLSCQGYIPVQYIDPDILKSAQEAHDNRMHKENKYGSRNVQKRASAVEHARAVQSPQERRVAHEPIRDAAMRASRVDALRAWRKAESDKANIPAYCIFHNSTLNSLASANITQKSELLNIRGIGAKVYAKYGDAIFEILRKH